MKLLTLFGISLARWSYSFVLVALAVFAAGAFAQPFTSNGVIAVLDLDDDGLKDATYEQFGSLLHNAPYPYYRSGAFLRRTDFLSFLRSAANRIDFSREQTISSTNPVYGPTAQDANPNILRLAAYDAENHAFTGWRYYAYSPDFENQFYTNKTEVFIGVWLRRRIIGSRHFGWLQFTRPDTDVATPFALASYDWNPLPDQPIAAGQPPVIPLAYEVTPDRLRLSWPAPVAGWILESSRSLGPAANWFPEPNSSPTTADLPFDASTRFYRLRKP
jgi:hypothetical protein